MWEKACQLQNFWLLRNVAKQTLVRLMYNLELREYRKGEFLIKEGEEAKGLYFIMSGEFIVRRKDNGNRHLRSSSRRGRGEH